MATSETALLAGGCFWGMEDLIRKQPGILDTDVGYSGGTLDNPTYKDVCTGQTGHAESIKIVFDNEKVSYRQILEFFFQIHDPTTVDRQGNDRGSQYRSAIFYLDEKQRQTALEVIEAVNASGKWPGLVVTQVEAAGPFWPAERQHQDYLEAHPEGYTCHFVRPEWSL